MADVRKMAAVKPRRRNSDLRAGLSTATAVVQQAGSGLLTKNSEGGALTYKLETMGCQMNLADSERIEGQLQSLGIRPLRDDGNETGRPDIVIMNTCSIRDHAEQKLYSYIGPHRKRKREGEDLTIIVAGCVAQQEGEKLLRRAPEIDMVLGPQYVNRIGEYYGDVQQKGASVMQKQVLGEFLAFLLVVSLFLLLSPM